MNAYYSVYLFDDARGASYPGFIFTDPDAELIHIQPTDGAYTATIDGDDIIALIKLAAPMLAMAELTTIAATVADAIATLTPGDACPHSRQESEAKP